MYQILQHNADNSGCGHYRLKMPSWSAQTLRRDIRIIDSMKLIPIPEFYKDIRMVRIQRQVSDEQCEYILKFLKPLSQRYGFWLVYEVDDVIHMDDIPRYNSAWAAYQNPNYMENVKKILKVCDILTVTTQELGDYFVRKFEVDKENVFVIPNHLPKWWIGDSYHIDKITQRFEKNVIADNKPRIGVLSSATHYDIKNATNGVDDLSHLNDYIISTVDKFQWVFVGGISSPLQHLVNSGKIEFSVGYDLLNYPRSINKLNLDIVVAPLMDNIFNHCKSNIKYLEMSALGIIPLVQDLAPYKKCTDLRFRTAADLDKLITNVLSSKERYLEIIQKNYDVIDKGDKYAPLGWWLENNMDRWYKLFCIPQKTMSFDLTNCREKLKSSATAINTNVKVFDVKEDEKVVPEPVKFEV